MGQTLNIMQFWSIIRKRILFIISLGVLFSVISFVSAIYLITPTYEASRQIVVNNTNPDQNLDYNTVMTNFQYANTYSDIIYSEMVLGKVIKDLKLNMSYKELAKDIDVTSKKESQVITITVRDADYELALDIVNKIATVFRSQAIEIMKIDNIELFPVTETTLDPEPIYPKPVLFTLVGLIAGLIMGVTISFLLQVFSNRITSERDIEELLHIPVIGSVSAVQPKDLMNTQNSALEKVRLPHSKGIGGKSVER
ncbi:MAG: Wzz/FepE/Etk N-terminal domain-containing protein [Bacillus sp. (in: firmicutes)]